MLSDTDWGDSGDESYSESRPDHRRKRRKVVTKGRSSVPLDYSSLFAPLLTSLAERYGFDDSDEPTSGSFDQTIGDLLSDLIQAETSWLERQEVDDESGRTVRPLSKETTRRLLSDMMFTSGDNSPLSVAAATIRAKLRLQSAALRHELLNGLPPYLHDSSVTPLPTHRMSSTVNHEVIDALYSIGTTTYEHSFLSRLQGFTPTRKPGVIAVDWETCSPWMELMSDIREHHALAHPDCEQPPEVRAPIEYMPLRPCHLDQIHDLLGRVFWAGIDVSDSLQYSPEKCTIVAVYKQLVVGAAFLSSPLETYITYLAVRAGWDNSQIATSMLYHLITLNPNKDITLHVSIPSDASV
ncbi:hypothetical protein A0H81_05926 [Grifola frondosa]|uniref:N-acetyltransferase domain-containing protein n=1 Tax=Grifola frondosa TaxID=5627 RepID=A0A1C7MB72_GRIFR|nr:hypothetical protein A0H81_05926 [Grifola frondosa]